MSPNRAFARVSAFCATVLDSLAATKFSFSGLTSVWAELSVPPAASGITEARYCAVMKQTRVS